MGRPDNDSDLYLVADGNSPSPYIVLPLLTHSLTTCPLTSTSHLHQPCAGAVPSAHPHQPHPPIPHTQVGKGNPESIKHPPCSPSQGPPEHGGQRSANICHPPSHTPSTPPAPAIAASIQSLRTTPASRRHPPPCRFAMRAAGECGLSTTSWRGAPGPGS